VLTIGNLSLTQENNLPAISLIYNSLSSPIVKYFLQTYEEVQLRFVGAGTPLKTLPTISNIDP
jgi:hypothetical protein